MPPFPAHDTILPILSVVYNAPGERPVVVNVFSDWETSGEVHTAFTVMDDLENANKVLQFAQDAVADILLQADQSRKAEEDRRNKDIPF